jgi:diguanylate cyclase (GGDEF)-like protein
MDHLTGLADSSDFFAWLSGLPSDKRTSLVLFDVDDLRLLNERHGVEQLDRMLVRLGSCIRERRANGEVAARVGGDEFALSLPEDDVSETVDEVEGIRRRFGDESGGITLSVWICDSATLRRGSESLSLYQAAGDALAEAKKQRPAGLTIYRPRW